MIERDGWEVYCSTVHPIDDLLFISTIFLGWSLYCNGGSSPTKNISSTTCLGMIESSDWMGFIDD